MPRLGQVGGNYPGDSTTEQRALADALCQLYRQLRPATQEINARRLKCSPPALSGYLNARHVPVRKLLEDLHQAARADCTGPVSPLLDDLFELHQQASVRPCDRCKHQSELRCAQCGRAFAAQSRVRRRTWRRGVPRPGRPTVPGVTAEVVLPVPPPEGDRQDEDFRPPVWTGLEEAIQHLRDGRDRDAHLVLTEAGERLPVHRIPDVVADCHGVGFAIAADAVLHSAARRPSREVLHIVRMFNEAKRYAEADLVLRVSTAG